MRVESIKRWHILTVGWLVFLLYAYPGFTSPDSLHQLHEARTGVIGDWHPPFMTFTWRLCEWLYTGTFPMLVLQSVTFLLGLDGILRRFVGGRAAAILAAGILIFPPVLTVMAVIWKDSQMAGFLLAGIAGLLSDRRRWKVLGCVCLFVATADRYNALAATLPIVLLLFSWNAWTGLRRYALAAALWIAITASASVANTMLTSYKDYPWVNSIAFLDIAGTLKYSHVTDEQTLEADLAGVPLAYHDDLAARIRRAYLPTAHYQLTHDEGRLFNFPDDSQRDSVKSAWFHLVMKYPRAYVWHRWKVFNEVLGMTSRLPAGAVWDGTPDHGRIQAVWVRTLIALQGSLLFRAYAYFILALALLVAARRSRLMVAILSSGIVCELSLLIGAPSNDYRYSHWMITCTVIVAVIAFAHRFAEGRRH